MKKCVSILKKAMLLSTCSFTFLLADANCQYGSDCQYETACQSCQYGTCCQYGANCPFASENESNTENTSYFKPQGIPLSDLSEVILESDEFEAFKLSNFDNLSEAEAAKQMGISQSTFVEILQSASKKIAEALVTDKALQINKKN
jgi:predicted DNA-binding protein (UPF0251 family)